ncbi:prepilin-type N-terminal cleavage/methylation domain-containing protein [Oceanobacillus luteolus]|mgnify:CR=1 FL=1|uniref:ComG operon protein 3 n=1 Tax=Oceanobacillus luteolus TaxID=1274358 RepID=A0ABW4HXZ1_9BACI|nr:competence type IV pilus major pilin ComGC [Oceanobacillus luteolus]MCM3738744.1 prepilin-type N-terminal cleavage/methylation domain-containing protein [Oceanobacillus luteolus]
MLKNNKGFTLIEMLIVMLIISVLLILIIPNLTSQSKNVNDKGCDALVAVVQAQADAYYLDKGQTASSIQTLIENNYLEENQKTCGDSQITVSNGKATIKSPQN